jgi:adenylosuccinate synthase
MLLEEGKLNLILGISFGSEGKGNVCEYIARNCDIDLAIANNTPNAGHFYHTDDGEERLAKVLPVCGIVNKKSNILLGSGSAINIDILNKEMAEADCANRTLISATAPVVNQKCIDWEVEHLQYIASTFQGSGAAIGLKAMRSKDIQIVRDVPELEKYCHFHLADIIMNRLQKHGKTALAEICQGYGLSVDSEFYPYCTSRPVNAGQALGYLDVPPQIVGNVIGVTRTYIIRVGNVPEGYSGDTYFDSEEKTWEEISEHIGRPVSELTSVTKRVRRVFTFSKHMFEQAVRRNGVNVLFLTFCDYLVGNEKQEFIDYLTSDQFNFKEIYFVSGFGEFDNNVEKIK